MKIGILTFHFAHNYGAMIQAYAMQTYLQKLGHQSFVIDYTPEYHTKWFRRQIKWHDCIGRSPRFCYMQMRNKILHGSAIAERYDSFTDFYKKRLNLYPYTPADDMSFFDAVLLGSDQIWNIGLTGGEFDPLYFGEGFKSRVFSYAASAMFKTFSESEKHQFEKRLAPLYGIGVREPNLHSLLQPLTSKKVSVNIDPSLLIESKDYDNLNLSRPLKEKYVVVYELQPDPKVREMAENYAKVNGFKTVLLTGNIFHHTGRGFDLTASPEKFISYIKNAECVFTSSFHGTALSIVFNTPFYSIKYNTPKDDRVEALLSQLDIPEQFINKSDRPTICKIDFDSVNSRLKELKKSSKDYIGQMLAF